MRYFNQIVLVAGMLVLTSCQSPQERVWLDDIEQIPVSSESSNSDPSLYTTEPQLFEDIFKKVSEVQLADDVVLGDRMSPVIGPQGQILAMDGDLAILFDASGKMIAQVTPDACNPGHNWSPSNAQFLPDGGFLVFGFSRDGYWFDATGRCTKVFPHRAFTRAITILEDSTVVAAKLSNVDWHLVEYGLEAADVDTLFSGIYTQLGTRIIAGGMISNNSGDLFIGVFHSPFVYRFQNGQFEKLGRIPDYFNIIPSDLTETEIDDRDSWMQKMQGIIRDNSALGSIFALDDESLAVFYINVDQPDDYAEVPSPTAIHIMDWNGNPITKGPIFLRETRPIYAGNGAFYTRVYDESGLDEAPLNPKIVEYRFASE
jgi:hypothetical protein